MRRLVLPLAGILLGLLLIAGGVAWLVNRDRAADALAGPDARWALFFPTFCLGSRYQVVPEVPGTPASPAINHNCGRSLPGLMRMRMGIDVGYADDYAAFVEFQYIDLSGVRPGRYLLAHQGDPDGHLVVGDRSDDTAYALIDLTPPRRAGGLPGVSVVATSVGTPPVAPPS